MILVVTTRGGWGRAELLSGRCARYFNAMAQDTRARNTRIALFALAYPSIPTAAWVVPRAMEEGLSGMSAGDVFALFVLVCLGALHGVFGEMLARVWKRSDGLAYVGVGALAAIPSALIAYAFVADPSHNLRSEAYPVLGGSLLFGALGTAIHLLVLLLKLNPAPHRSEQF